MIPNSGLLFWATLYMKENVETLHVSGV